MATADLGAVKLDVLLRLHGSEDAPHEVATVEIPLRDAKVVDGKLQCAPDFSEFGRLGRLLAAAIEEEWHA